MIRWLALLLLSSCSPGSWDLVAVDLAEAPLSVTGDSGIIWMVGGDTGAGPLVLRFDGAWDRLDSGDAGDLWWAWASAGGGVWAVGEGGRALRFDPSGELVRHDILDPAVTFFGVWGSADDAIWAVGGDLSAPQEGPAVYFFDGEVWTAHDLGEDLGDASLAYKVWGTASDDVWIVGEGGLIAHFNGTAWRRVESGTTRTLFTVHGSSAAEVYAVGGFGSGTLLAFDGARWTDASPQGAPALSGVHATADQIWSVGGRGGVVHGRPGAWEPVEPFAFTERELHAVFVDEEQGVWAVGGAIASQPLDQGVIGYRGPDKPTSFL